MLVTPYPILHHRAVAVGAAEFGALPGVDEGYRVDVPIPVEGIGIETGQVEVGIGLYRIERFAHALEYFGTQSRDAAGVIRFVLEEGYPRIYRRFEIERPAPIA